MKRPPARQESADAGQKADRPAAGYLHRDSKPNLPGLLAEPSPKPAARLRKRIDRNPMKEFYATNIKRLVLSLGAMLLVLFVVYQVAKRAAVPKPRAAPRSAPARQAAPKPAPGTEETLDAESSPVSKGEIIRSAVDMVKEGMLLEAAEQVDQALVKYQTAARLWPPVPDAMRLTARIHARRGEYDHAVLALQRALEQEPDRLDLQTELGRCQLELGRIPQAHEVLKKVLETDPTHRAAYVPYARCLAARGNVDDARRLIRHYLESAPGDADAHYQLAMLEASSKDFERSLASLETAIRLKPGQAVLHREAAAAAALLGQLEGALAHLAQAEQASQPAEILVTFRQPAFDALRATQEGRAYEQQLVERAQAAPSAPADAAPGTTP